MPASRRDDRFDQAIESLATSMVAIRLSHLCLVGGASGGAQGAAEHGSSRASECERGDLFKDCRVVPIRRDSSQ